MINKLILALYVLSTSFALIILKLGAKDGAPASFIDGRLQLNINLYTIGGIIFYGISFLVYMYLISRYDLGYIIPLTTALVYVLIFTTSFFIFKETFSIYKIAGILLLLLGLLLINIKN